MDNCVVQEDEMPEEVNIDDLLDLKTDEERTRRLQVTPVCPSVRPVCLTCLSSQCVSLSLQETFLSCNNNTEVRAVEKQLVVLLL